jgi:hypothetical protein
MLTDPTNWFFLSYFWELGLADVLWVLDFGSKERRKSYNLFTTFGPRLTILDELVRILTPARQ